MPKRCSCWFLVKAWPKAIEAPGGHALTRRRDVGHVDQRHVRDLFTLALELARDLERDETADAVNDCVRVCILSRVSHICRIEPGREICALSYPDLSTRERGGRKTSLPRLAIFVDTPNNNEDPQSQNALVSNFYGVYEAPG